MGITPDFNHTDLDGDTLRVQEGVTAVVFTARDGHTDDLAMVAVRPDDLALLISSLQAMHAELVQP